jgi:hypothetical protein
LRKEKVRFKCYYSLPIYYAFEEILKVRSKRKINEKARKEKKATRSS